ncbi:MAG TPA: universal stress protein [Ktedonobacteraceae bacterium]
MTTTRLLLPFTGNINSLALNYAVQLAEQRQATLVPLALVRVKALQPVRVDFIQQAQDFLELTRRKAERCGVPVEQARIYTGDVVLSIEALAGEMNCETVILCLSHRRELLLERGEIRELLERAACNAHVVLLLSRRERNYPPHFPQFKRANHAAQAALI